MSLIQLICKVHSDIFGIYEYERKFILKIFYKYENREKCG